MSRGERAPLNEGLPNSEAVAAPALSGADFDLLGGVLDPQTDARVAVGYLHATHPETGVEVVFVPGEALPGWAQEVQKARLLPTPAKADTRRKPTGQRSVRAQQEADSKKE